MALATWLGVFLRVFLWSSILPKVLMVFPAHVVLAIVNVFVVITLAGGVMPLLTRVLGGWLHISANGNQ